MRLVYQFFLEHAVVMLPRIFKLSMKMVIIITRTLTVTPFPEVCKFIKNFLSDFVHTNCRQIHN